MPSTQLSAHRLLSMQEKPSRLLICITFHFLPSRLVYLKKIATQFSELADFTKIVIITNDRNAHLQISEVLSPLGLNLEILSPTLLGHPYLLAWCHKDVFRQHLDLKQCEFTHYLYLEDDILITEQNIHYWMEARERLRPFGLLPSFVRFEVNASSQQRVSTDSKNTVDSSRSAKIIFPDLNYAYLNLPNPYQATYLLDNELLAEHFFDVSSYSPDAPPAWNLSREKAALGLTFHRIPYGFEARNVVGYRMDLQRLDERSLIHHTPNNYANDSTSGYGKIEINQLIHPAVAMPNRVSRRHFQPDGSLYWLPRAPLQERLKSVYKRMAYARK